MTPGSCPGRCAHWIRRGWHDGGWAFLAPLMVLVAVAVLGVVCGALVLINCPPPPPVWVLVGLAVLVNYRRKISVRKADDGRTVRQ